MVDALDSITGDLAQIRQDTNPSKAELDAKRLGDDFETFLLLLTTQLENQDPTEPLDTNEFTSQLVQFAGVEQQVATNRNIEKLVAAMRTSGVNEALGYIGKAIDAEGNKGVLQDGEAVFMYELPSTANSVDVTILDKNGRAVFSGEGNTGAGKNLVFWDGTDSVTGQTLPNGVYQIVVKAKGFDGEEIDATTYTTGVVSSVETDSEGNALLLIGNEKVPASTVRAIRQPSIGLAQPQPPANDNQQQDDLAEDDTVSSDENIIS